MHLWTKFWSSSWIGVLDRSQLCIGGVRFEITSKYPFNFGGVYEKLRARAACRLAVRFSFILR